MSRDLPANPSLEYLKKHAKELLHDWRQTMPDAKLSSAQHALARDYGFDSWPKLRAHVERVHGSSAHPIEATWAWSAADAQPDPYRSVTLQFDVTDDDVTIIDVVTDASGREQRTENTIRADGREYPQAHGYAVTARWVNSHTLEAIGSKDGHVEGRVMYAVSPDGRTLTLSTAERVLVLERR